MKLPLNNGVFFVKSNKDVVNSLFEGPKTAGGTYKVKSKGILFKDMNGGPIAYLCANDESSPFFVTASYNTPQDKRTRYMFGCAEYTEKALGINGMGYREGRELALKIWKEFKKPAGN